MMSLESETEYKTLFENVVVDISNNLDMALQINFNKAIENWEQSCLENEYTLQDFYEDNWESFIDELKSLVSNLYINGLEDDAELMVLVESYRTPLLRLEQWLEENQDEIREAMEPQGGMFKTNIDLYFDSRDWDFYVFGPYVGNSYPQGEHQSYVYQLHSSNEDDDYPGDDDEDYTFEDYFSDNWGEIKDQILERAKQKDLDNYFFNEDD